MPQGWPDGQYETRGAGWFCYGSQPPAAGACERDISDRVRALCHGHRYCTVPASREAYPPDPCAGKHGPGPGYQVAVRVTCTTDGTSSQPDAATALAKEAAMRVE